MLLFIQSYLHISLCERPGFDWAAIETTFRGQLNCVLLPAHSVHTMAVFRLQTKYHQNTYILIFPNTLVHYYHCLLVTYQTVFYFCQVPLYSPRTCGFYFSSIWIITFNKNVSVLHEQIRRLCIWYFIKYNVFNWLQRYITCVQEFYRIPLQHFTGISTSVT